MTFFYSNEDINSGDLSSASSDDQTLVGSESTTSVGSMPWAEDAIRQNEEEWQKIERMFYGEEEPSDPKIRDEILDWVEAFPHLRIIGTPAPIHYIPRNASTSMKHEYHEEIIAIDPPKSSKFLNRYTNRSRDTTDRDSSIKNLNTDIAKYLKIAPSPVFKLRSIDKPKEIMNHPVGASNPYIFKIPSSHGIRLLNPQPNHSLSASHVRMPPILSIKILPTFHKAERAVHIKSAAFSELKTRVTLPAIDVDKLSETSRQTSDKKTTLMGRSISAAVTKKKSYEKIPN